MFVAAVYFAVHTVIGHCSFVLCVCVGNDKRKDPHALLAMVTNHTQIQMAVKENRDTQGAHPFPFFIHVVIIIDQYKYPQMSRANIKETAEKGLLLGCSSFTGQSCGNLCFSLPMHGPPCLPSNLLYLFSRVES